MFTGQGIRVTVPKDFSRHSLNSGLVSRVPRHTTQPRGKIVNTGQSIKATIPEDRTPFLETVRIQWLGISTSTYLLTQQGEIINTDQSVSMTVPKNISLLLQAFLKQRLGPP